MRGHAIERAGPAAGSARSCSSGASLAIAGPERYARSAGREARNRVSATAELEPVARSATIGETWIAGLPVTML